MIIIGASGVCLSPESSRANLRSTRVVECRIQFRSDSRSDLGDYGDTTISGFLEPWRCVLFGMHPRSDSGRLPRICAASVVLAPAG